MLYDNTDKCGRYGLVLAYPRVIEAIPCRGKQGIWYVDVNEQPVLSAWGKTLIDGGA